MLSNTLLVSSLFVASAMAVAAPAPTPYKLGLMSLNDAFGLAKRQAGYQPTQTYCNYGATCAEACGPTQVQCPSSDNQLHCYDPAVNQHCCPDGTGNSCDSGYFCTADSLGGTWCCPDGMTLAQCAAAYSLTDSLVSETAAATSTVAAVSTTPVSVSASTTSAPASTSTPAGTTTKAPASTTTIAAKTSSISGGSTKTTSSTAIQVTGAAGHMVAGGLNAIALGAAALLVL